MELPLEISIEDAQTAIARNTDELLLLDCRNQHEYDFVRLDDSVLIPMDEITTRVSELQVHQAKPTIVVYCHMGVRSGMVTQWLRQNGFPQAQSLAGGIDAWSVHVDPKLPRY